MFTDALRTRKEKASIHTSISHHRIPYSCVLLTQPEPNLLKHIPGNLFWPDLSIKRSLAAPNIRRSRIDELRTLEDLPKSVEENEDSHTNVRREEVRDLRCSPRMYREHLEAVEDDDQSEVRERCPGNVWLALAPEEQSAAIDTLKLLCLPEARVGVANGAPGEELGNGGQVLEPGEDCVGASRDAHECEQRDGRGDGYTVVWYTPLRALEKEPGSLAVLGYCEEIAGAGVEESVAR